MCKVIPTHDPATGRRLSFDEMAAGLMHCESLAEAERFVARYPDSKSVIIPKCYLRIEDASTREMLKQMLEHFKEDWEEVLNPPFWFKNEAGDEVTTAMLREDLVAILDLDYVGDDGTRSLLVGRMFGRRAARAVVLLQLESCFNGVKPTNAMLNHSVDIVNNIMRIWCVLNRRERWGPYLERNNSVKGQLPVNAVEDALSHFEILWVDSYKGANSGGDSMKHPKLTPKTKEAFGIQDSDLTFGEEMERLTPDSKAVACLATEYKM
jgi:hypothetical protein